MNIKRLNILKDPNVKTRIVALALAGTLSLPLTGCGSMFGGASGNKSNAWNEISDSKNTFDYAIEVNGNVATIIPIKTWIDYEGEQLQIVTPDDTMLIVSSFNTRFMNTLNGDITPWDYARALVGETGEIKVLGSELVDEKGLSLKLKP